MRKSNLIPLVAYLRSVEDVLHGQHGDDGEHLFTAAQMNGHDQHLTQHGLQRELGHLNTDTGVRYRRRIRKLQCNNLSECLDLSNSPHPSTQTRE